MSAGPADRASSAAPAVDYMAPSPALWMDPGISRRLMQQRAQRLQEATSQPDYDAVFQNVAAMGAEEYLLSVRCVAAVVIRGAVVAWLPGISQSTALLRLPSSNQVVARPPGHPPWPTVATPMPEAHAVCPARSGPEDGPWLVAALPCSAVAGRRLVDLGLWFCAQPLACSQSAASGHISDSHSYLLAQIQRSFLLLFLFFFFFLISF